MLFRFIMIVVSLEVEHIFIELILCLSYLVLGTDNVFIALFLELLILVAVVISTGLLPMLFPIAETEPAEFMRTQFTRHMIATLILLNSTFALRTSLSIGHNPGNIFTFIRVLGFPTVSYLTRTGSV